MKGGSSNKKIGNGLVALSSAAVLAVYTAGYQRTRSAADRFAMDAIERRPADPFGESAAAPGAAPSEPSDAPPPAGRITSTEPGDPSAAPALKRAARTAPPAIVPADTPIAPVSAERPLAQTSEAPTAAAATIPPAIAAEPPAAPVATPPSRYKDGTYLGWGTSRHGDIQAAVVVEDGRIASATIAQCLTRYSCSVIAALPPQVASRQSPDVDYVSGATQSANAFYYAVVDALAKAK
jgi:uncharacterized protein with FMN-binding domain